MYCYKCGDILTDKNKSKEHIINDFLGGHITSRELLCKICNGQFGETLDAELNNQIGVFSDIIGVFRTSKRQKKNINIMLESLSGDKIRVGKNLNPKSKVNIKNPNTGETKVIYVDEEDLDKFIEEKNEEVKKKYGKEIVYTKYSELTTGKRYYIKNDTDFGAGKFIIGGNLFYRAIGKMILNFFLSRKPNERRPQHLIDYVCNGQKTAYRNLFLYYPATYKIYEPIEKEFSHVLYLIGDKTTGSIYCYLDLFNTFGFLCVLDLEYLGDGFEEQYCVDLKTGKEIKKEINIIINRNLLEDYNNGHYPYKVYQDGLQKKLKELEKRIEDLQDEYIVI
jgi:hypothetical protein